jgi:hypothetical protein
MKRVVRVWVVLLVLTGLAFADDLSTTITYTSLATTFDPNIDNVIPTNYGSIGNLTVTQTNACYWNSTLGGSGAGDLDSMAYVCDSTSMKIAFTPENGTYWTIDSFDLAAATVADPGLMYVVSLADENGNVLWTSGSVLAPSYGHLTLSPGITFSNTVTMTASSSWDVGLSNIQLTDPSPVPAPEPGTMALIGVGMVGALRRRRH